MPGNDLKHTFIPKQPVANQGGLSASSGRSFNLLSGIASIILVITVMGAAGVYAYRAYLTKNVAGASVSLERAKAAFEPDTIVAMKRFSARVGASEGLLSRHIAPSVFFAVLEDLTLKTVRFSKFTYSFDGSEIGVGLGGTAKNYSSVALQSDFFSKSPYIKNPVFSNLNLDKSGNVTFEVTLQVDPALILYKEVVGRKNTSDGENQ